MLPQGAPVIAESCLTVPGNELDLLVVSERTVMSFMKNQLGQNEKIIPNAWHGIIKGWHVLKAPRHDLLKQSSAWFGEVSLHRYGFPG